MCLVYIEEIEFNFIKVFNDCYCVFGYVTFTAELMLLSRTIILIT